MDRYHLKTQTAVVSSIAIYCVTYLLVSCNRETIDLDDLPAFTGQQKADLEALKAKALPITFRDLEEIELEAKHELGITEEFTEMPDEPDTFVNLETGLVCQRVEQGGVITKLRYLVRAEQYFEFDERAIAKQHLQYFCQRTYQLVMKGTDSGGDKIILLLDDPPVSVCSPDGTVLINVLRQEYRGEAHLVFEVLAVIVSAENE